MIEKFVAPLDIFKMPKEKVDSYKTHLTIIIRRRKVQI